MNYELTLRASTATSLSEDALRQAFADPALQGQHSDLFQKSLPAGGALQLQLARQASGIAGLDASLPFDLRESDCRAALEMLFGLAEAQGLTLFDPQLNESVTRAEADAVFEKWQETRGFFQSTLGLVDVNPNEPLKLHETSFVERHFHWILLGTLALLMLLLLAKAIGQIIE